jgi:hypothetical protein
MKPEILYVLSSAVGQQKKPRPPKGFDSLGSSAVLSWLTGKTRRFLSSSLDEFSFVGNR